MSDRDASCNLQWPNRYSENTSVQIAIMSAEIHWMVPFILVWFFSIKPFTGKATKYNSNKANWINHQLNLPISIFFLIAFWPWYINESNIPETVKTPVHNTQNPSSWIKSDISNETTFNKFNKVSQGNVLELPPTIAHIFVRKCKNEICSTVKVTYSMQVIQ